MSYWSDQDAKSLWPAVAVAVAFGAIGALLHLPGLPLSPRPRTWVAILGGIVAGALFGILLLRSARSASRREATVRRMERELVALHEAELALSADLTVDNVLRNVVDRARDLLGTRYGALSVVDDRARITSFVTSGIDHDTATRIGPPPQGRGLLGVVLRDGQSLRLEDMSEDPRSVGFPEHHPQLEDLLAVPVSCAGPYRGNLYVSTKQDGGGFTSADEVTLRRFAQHAAIAIDNAFLHQQVQELAAAKERRLLAHEVHDGVAQALASVITRSQVVDTHLRAGRGAEALRQLDALETTAREAYEEVRGQILDYRTSILPSLQFVDILNGYLDQWSEQTGVEVVRELPLTLRVPRNAELQLLRIVQEALTNVRRHADASQVHLSIQSSETGVTTTVRDDGRGFSPEAPSRPGGPRFGLATMRERAESLGGRLEVTPQLDVGTEVSCHLPRHLATEEEGEHAADHR
ncbi:MAG: GAF domain-containing sensor histidine kinase [Thermoanaerobaculia bacterium]|nr:GAF domain-containing sensor histidine kinase [Thermoanaerobaculia bacterium]